jgi:hypothetical protein
MRASEVANYAVMSGAGETVYLYNCKNLSKANVRRVDAQRICKSTRIATTGSR